MAEKLDEFDFKKNAKYPWDEWFDGGVWRLKRGEDYLVSSAAFGTTARSAAKTRGGTVIVSGTATDVVVLQFTASTNGAKP